jgi:hypothetical protein
MGDRCWVNGASDGDDVLHDRANIDPCQTRPLEERKAICAYTRRVASKDGAESGEELKFFDETRVPVQTVVLMHADLEGVAADQYEGYFAGSNSAPSMLASSSRSSSTADCTASIPARIWSTCCSKSANIPRAASPNSRRY